ncbi:MAG: hypothetical protein Q4E73_02785 [Lachnospiraceae bacterium]|nr:hypothetical protein [Lachnospiraceae bacterium]
MKKKELLTIGEFIFCCALFCEVISLMISLTTIPYMVNTDLCNLCLKLLRYVGYLLIIFKFIYEKVSLKEIILIAGIILLLGINSIVNDKALFMTFIFIYGMKNVRFEKVIQILSAWFAGCFVLIVIGSQLGLIDNWVYGLDDGRKRVSLGFFYPSHATSAFFYLTMLFCYVKKDNLRFWQVIVLEALNIWQYKQTDSRTGTALIAIALILFYLLQYKKGDLAHSMFGFCLKCAFPVCAGISVFCCLFYDKIPALQGVNQFLSDRISLGHNGIVDYGIHVWGQKIEWVGHGGSGYINDGLTGVYSYVDCSYVRILLECGIIVWIVILAGFTLASKVSVDHNEKYLAVALLFIAGYSIIEPRLLDIGFNPFMLVLANLIGYTECFIQQENRQGVMIRREGA